MVKIELDRESVWSNVSGIINDEVETYLLHEIWSPINNNFGMGHRTYIYDDIELILRTKYKKRYVK